MVIFPICKINLGLQVTRKRPDGYHDLETVFYPIQLTDVLEIVHQQGPTNDLFQPKLVSTSARFFQSGITIEGNASDNLCPKAYGLLKERFDALPAIDLHLHKKIPIGAGLGGGSSDAAYTLKLLNQKFQLGLTLQQLERLALELGSDCPFFIQSVASYAQGRGEQLEPMTLDLSSYSILIVDPGIHISTAAAFREIIPKEDRTSIKEIISQPIGEWSNNLINDFEKPMFSKFPVLARIKSDLYNAGALYCSMSGSGSSIFAIFPSRSVELPELSRQGATIHWT